MVDKKSALLLDPCDGCVENFFISGQYIEQFSSFCSAQGMMGGPFGIAIDGKDYVYIREAILYMKDYQYSRTRESASIAFTHAANMKTWS